jgi:hypothetical protein
MVWMRDRAEYSVLSLGASHIFLGANRDALPDIVIAL